MVIVQERGCHTTSDAKTKNPPRLDRVDFAEINHALDAPRGEDRFFRRPRRADHRPRVSRQLSFVIGNELAQCQVYEERELLSQRTLYRISPVVVSQTVTARSAPPAATIVPFCPSGDV